MTHSITEIPRLCVTELLALNYGEVVQILEFFDPDCIIAFEIRLHRPGWLHGAIVYSAGRRLKVPIVKAYPLDEYGVTWLARYL